MQPGNVLGVPDKGLTEEELAERTIKHLTLDVQGHNAAFITVRGEHTPGKNSDALFVNNEPASLEKDPSKPKVLLLVADGATNEGKAAKLFTGAFVAGYVTFNLPQIFNELDLEKSYEFSPLNPQLQEQHCLTFDELYRWILPRESELNAYSDSGQILRYILRKYYETFWKPQFKKGAAVYLELVGIQDIVQDGDKLKFLLKNGEKIDQLFDGTSVDELTYIDQGRLKLNQAVLRLKTLELLRDKNFKEIASLMFGPNLFKPNTKENTILRLIYALYEVTSRLSEIFSNEFKGKFEGAQYLESGSTLAGVIETADFYIHFTVGDTLVFSFDKNGNVKSNSQTVASNTNSELSSFIGTTLHINGHVTPHYPKAIDIRVLPKSEANDLLTVVLTDGAGNARKIPALAKLLAVCTADEAVEVMAVYLKQLFNNNEHPDDATAAFLEL